MIGNRSFWSLTLYFVLPFSLLYCDPSAYVLAEGKTKIVCACAEDPYLAVFEAKDDLTAGDGAKHDIIPGKAKLATATTCNVFRLLADCQLPLTFRKQLDANKFLAVLCEMIPYEVVVRREAHGSYIKRHPDLKKGMVFPDLIVEFFLKTSGKQWKGQAIPKDDPFIQFQDDVALLYRADVPVENQEPFMALTDFPLYEQPDTLDTMALIAKQTFLALEKLGRSKEGVWSISRWNSDLTPWAIFFSQTSSIMTPGESCKMTPISINKSIAMAGH